MTDRKCDVCEEPLRVTWTDTHGVAYCLKCGTPYRVYHYEGNKRVDKPIETTFCDWYVPFAKRYWNEAKRPMPTGYSFCGTREAASQEDIDAFAEWCRVHENEMREAFLKEGVLNGTEA